LVGWETKNFGNLLDVKL